VVVMGFKKCCIPNGMDGTDDDMLWNSSEEGGNVKKMKVVTVKTEIVTLIGKGR